MTDEQLAQYLGIADDALGLRIVRALSAENRAAYEHMHQVECEVAMWQAGLGPKPKGVLIDEDRKRRYKR